MPCSHVIDKEKRLVIGSAWDRVTFADVINHQDPLQAAPAFNPASDRLVEASAVTAIDASFEEVKKPANRRIFIFRGTACLGCPQAGSLWRGTLVWRTFRHEASTTTGRGLLRHAVRPEMAHAEGTSAARLKVVARWGERLTSL